MLTWILIGGGAVLGAFAAYDFWFFAASVVARFCRSGVLSGTGAPVHRFGIIVPAHNEEQLIGGLIRSVKASTYPASHYEIFVIADNCTDATVQIARDEGARAFERVDRERRGKPHALNWFISKKLELGRFDAFVVVDADTVVDQQFLSVMDRYLQKGEKVIQGYFGVMNPDENWLTRLSILPGVLKYLLHHPGKKLMRLSCPLAGNGMCFSAEVFRRFGWTAFSLAENWEYYIYLTLEGYRVTSAEEAKIYSQVARSLRLGKNQRVRWLKGRVETLTAYWQPLLRRGLLNRDTVALDALIELMRPSHSMLFLGSLLYLGAAALVQSQSGGGETFLGLAALITGSQIVFFLSGLVVQRAPLRTWLSLVMVPPYLVWKSFVSLNGLLTLHNKEWIKTKRNQ